MKLIEKRPEQKNNPNGIEGGCMSTYTQILYQLVFSTKNREKVITEEKENELFSYIWGILKNKNCHLYQINGTSNHIHILTSIHPSVALADLIKDIKVSTNLKIKEENLFPNFKGWQSGYGAFTYSIEAKDNLIEYVKNQKRHHQKTTFLDEYKKLLKDFLIEYDEKYLE
ncbi:MAG TPA: IS200/IS605 family transposase [Ignavibacteriaceae bacterium]|nr:IS200/IS605 family transposase [Ignavibacteriaceae bacterium]